jgi:4-alpha-glucanotransferase
MSNADSIRPDTRPDSLNRLDSRIADCFVDAWGQRRPVTSTTLAALQTALAAVAPASTPAVQVHRISQGPLTLVIPASFTHWQLHLEATVTPTQAAAVQGNTLSIELPLGYHELIFTGPQGELRQRVIGVPDQCYLPEPLQQKQQQNLQQHQRVWGIALQLYTLRSTRNWGVGDFTDLIRFSEQAAAFGVEVIGLNPLHALYPANPAHISPYSPSHREYLNWIYIDPQAVPEFTGCEAAHTLVASTSFQRQLATTRATEKVDYVAVAALKRPVLEALFTHFLRAASPLRQQAFTDYQRANGADLHRHALFDALQESFATQAEPLFSWQQWPQALQNPDSASCQQFARERAERVQFFCWLQWLAETQLAAAQQRCRQLGMRIGLYRDLAVGADRGGSEIWSAPDQFCQDISVGAPPDAVAVQGQNWGLPPFHPDALRNDGYRRFAALLRANMRHCGALRIDHVMALFRLWWIPSGGTGTDGAYVHYPLADLAGIVALESQRQRCLVIGEDLGTVPEEIRRVMHETQMLSYRILMFEQHADRLKAPEEYPTLALATISTHDMPTLPGFWECEDIKLRDRLGLYDSHEQTQQQYAQRHGDKQKLLQALNSKGLYPEYPAQLSDFDDRIVLGAHVYLASSGAGIMMCQPEDWFGERHQVNLPGTSTENPNWQRKLNISIEEMFERPFARELAAAIGAARKK